MIAIRGPRHEWQGLSYISGFVVGIRHHLLSRPARPHGGGGVGFYLGYEERNLEVAA